MDDRYPYDVTEKRGEVFLIGDLVEIRNQNTSAHSMIRGVVIDEWKQPVYNNPNKLNPEDIGFYIVSWIEDTEINTQYQHNKYVAKQSWFHKQIKVICLSNVHRA